MPEDHDPGDESDDLLECSCGRFCRVRIIDGRYAVTQVAECPCGRIWSKDHQRPGAPEMITFVIPVGAPIFISGTVRVE